MSDAKRVYVSKALRRRRGSVDIVDKTVGWITSRYKFMSSEKRLIQRDNDAPCGPKRPTVEKVLPVPFICKRVLRPKPLFGRRVPRHEVVCATLREFDASRTVAKSFGVTSVGLSIICSGGKRRKGER